MHVCFSYRVARVEQTETPEMMKERNETSKKGGKKDKVVAREVCSVVSSGTRTYCHFDDNNVNDMISATSVLMSVKQEFVVQEVCDNMIDRSSVENVFAFGICVVNTVTSTVNFAGFLDSVALTKFRTLLAMFSPNEVLLELSSSDFSNTKSTINLLLPKCKVEFLRRQTEMLTGDETIRLIYERQYFKNKSIPEALDKFLNISTCKSNGLVLSAFGGAIFQLHRSLIDYEIISMGKMSSLSDKTFLTGLGDVSLGLEKSGNLLSLENNHETDKESQIMNLDDVALLNLEVLVNNFDKSEKGSLWAFLNRCQTPFGRRLLHSWICYPLFCTKDIKNRKDAVEELMRDELKDVLHEVKILLKDLPDLERLLARVHSNGLHRLNLNHPDSRAVLYENSVYTSRKIKDFASALSGFESLLKVGKFFENVDLNSELLGKALKSSFPVKVMDEHLKSFRLMFDERQAIKDGNIRPNNGVNPEYDIAKSAVLSCQLELEQYLADMKRKLGVGDMKFFGVNKDRYQIEVPISQVSKIPNDWTTKSQKKTHRRYWTKFVESKLSALLLAEERLLMTQGDTLRKIFEKFDSNYVVWNLALSCGALLDALLSLSLVSATPNFVWPSFCNRGADETSYLHIRNGRHPMLEFTLSQRYVMLNVF